MEFIEGEHKLDVHTVWPKKSEIVISNYPNGGKQRRIRNNPDRRTYGVRVNEKEVVFLSVIEPYKGESSIKKIESASENEITVTLKDGKVQTISIENLKGTLPKIKITETLGDTVKTEITK